MGHDQLDSAFVQQPLIKLITVVVLVVLIFLIVGLVRRIIPRYIAETESRYRARKFTNFLGYGLVVLAILVV